MKKWTTRQMLECLDQGPTGNIGQQAAAELRRLNEVNQELLRALNAILTHIRMDEDEWNKPTFDQARAALLKANGENK